MTENVFVISAIYGDCDFDVVGVIKEASIEKRADYGGDWAECALKEFLHIEPDDNVDLEYNDEEEVFVVSIGYDTTLYAVSYCGMR